MTLAEWLDAYRLAWENRDADAVVPLFSHGALYRSHRFSEPNVGREGIAGYWRRATDPQENVRVRFGEPIVQGERAAVEWRTTAATEGKPRTIAGCLFLRFNADGLCEELRECWHTTDGAFEPPDGWGR
jgi:hypothetical protein